MADRVEQREAATQIKQTELFLLGSVFLVKLFEEGVKGEILQFVLAYFCKFYEGREIRYLMPMISMIVSMCSENSAVPY